MELESAAEFLVGSILIGLGAITLTIAAVTINNILAKYWKPVKLWTPKWMDFPNANGTRFMTPEEEAEYNKRVAPTLDDTKPLDLSTKR